MLLAASGWFINVATIAGAIVAVIGAGLALFRLPPLCWLWHRNVTGPIKEGLGRTITTVARPLIDDAALKKMERQVADATAKGAEVITGGNRLSGPGFDDGSFFAPTILSDVTPDMLICSEETFGPIAPVMVFDDEDEAIRLANSTSYGLAGYIYTRDISRALRVAEALDFGMIGINDINPTSAAVPFGGIKDSGLGREGARAGIAEYLDTKVLGIAL